MNILIKAILAALLLGCLAKMPYGYYQFIRIGCCIAFTYLMYIEFKERQPVTGVLSGVCAVLYNPIIKVYLTRKTWNQIDLTIAIWLCVWAAIECYLQYGIVKVKPKTTTS